MTQIKEFKIEIPESELADLKLRLTLTRFPEKETPVDWSQGTPLSYVESLRDYWLKDYDWKERERLLINGRGSPQISKTLISTSSI